MFGISISDSIITMEYPINLLNLSELKPFLRHLRGNTQPVAAGAASMLR